MRYDKILDALSNAYRYADAAYWQLHETGDYESEELDEAVTKLDEVRYAIEADLEKLMLKADKAALQNPYAHVEELSDE